LASALTPNWALKSTWRTAPSAAEVKNEAMRMKLASAMPNSRVNRPRSPPAGRAGG
jgi:hypothetical protein